MTTALEGGEGSVSRPGRSLPPGKTRYPLYRRLGGPQGLSGQVRKISPPPGFDPRTVQPVASRYTDYATRPTNCVCVCWTDANITVTESQTQAAKYSKVQLAYKFPVTVVLLTLLFQNKKSITYVTTVGCLTLTSHAT